MESTDNQSTVEKQPSAKEGRIIVRNLPFDLKDNHLQKAFAKFGQIVGINVPIKNENNMNRGFGFVEFATKEEATKAIAEMNGQKYKGRLLTVEFSVPKLKYEQRISNILQNTKQTKQDIVQPKSVKQEKEEKQKQQEENKKQREQEKTIRDQQKQTKKVKPEKSNVQTLFVRNIGWDTTQEEFKEFMEKFGPLKYAVLCKSNALQSNENSIEQVGNHKGSGFVLFKDQDTANQVLELSQNIENQLDQERKQGKNLDKMKKKENGVDSSIAIISGELELNGRRLVIMQALSKDQAVNKKDEKEQEVSKDKRNLANKAFGLIDIEQWMHKTPAVSQEIFDQRQHLLKEKETALSKNTNLFVSNTRISMRHLPKKEFYEKELKELMVLVAEEWLKALDQEKKNQANKQKLVKQVKVLRDKQKVNSVTNEKLSSGIGFAEFGNEELAKFAVKYLNNMELINKKGLIVEFSLEDQRALHKRQQKLEKQKKLASEKKREDKLKNKNIAKEENYDNVVVDLGQKKVIKSNESGQQPIDKITDVEQLNKMMRETNSRGKKQRIKKRIDKLEGREQNQNNEQKVNTKEKVKELLRKREEKANAKTDKRLIKGVTEEEKVIMKKIKNKKKDAKRKKGKETDEFDEMLDKYKEKFLKRFQKSLGKSENTAQFEEIEMSE